MNFCKNLGRGSAPKDLYQIVEKTGTEGQRPETSFGALPLRDGFWYKKTTNITGRCPCLSFYEFFPM